MKKTIIICLLVCGWSFSSAAFEICSPEVIQRSVVDVKHNRYSFFASLNEIYQTHSAFGSNHFEQVIEAGKEYAEDGYQAPFQGEDENYRYIDFTYDLNHKYSSVAKEGSYKFISTPLNVGSLKLDGIVFTEVFDLTLEHISIVDKDQKNSSQESLNELLEEYPELLEENTDTCVMFVASALVFTVKENECFSCSELFSTHAFECGCPGEILQRIGNQFRYIVNKKDGSIKEILMPGELENVIREAIIIDRLQDKIFSEYMKLHEEKKN